MSVMILSITIFTCASKQEDPVTKSKNLPEYPFVTPEYTKEQKQMAKVVKGKGWIAYSAFTKNGTWDIFLCRPDGSNIVNITNTSDTEEMMPRFSPDGKKLLYRRIPKGLAVNHNNYGAQGKLILANSNGDNPKAIGEENEYQWADWSSDGNKFSYLTPKGIYIMDIKTKKELKSYPRNGIYQQLSWSPDNKSFCGTANFGGAVWSVVNLDIATNSLTPIIKFQSCTPDWFPDSKRIIYSSRPAEQSSTNKAGWTQLWMANQDGTGHKLIYGEDGRHIYGGCVSPDANYVAFTKPEFDGGGGMANRGAPMYIMRLKDAPIIYGKSPDLRRVHPKSNVGVVLSLPYGWEPDWTYSEIKFK
jgi:Tol biopolymer transport system component